MNEEMIQALYGRLMEDIEASKDPNLDPKEKKSLSEEIKAITNFLNSQDSLNLEWAKHAYQKEHDREEMELEREKLAYQKEHEQREIKSKRWDRIFGLTGDILKVAVILIQLGFGLAAIRAFFMYETDNPITSKMAMTLFGKFIMPKV